MSQGQIRPNKEQRRKDQFAQTETLNQMYESLERYITDELSFIEFCGIRGIQLIHFMWLASCFHLLIWLQLRSPEIQRSIDPLLCLQDPVLRMYILSSPSSHLSVQTSGLPTLIDDRLIFQNHSFHPVYILHLSP